MNDPRQPGRNGLEFIDTQPVVAVAEAEYRRLLGHPPEHQPGPRVEELAAQARAWFAAHGRPWIYLREAHLELTSDLFLLDGRTINSPQLRSHLVTHQATRAVLIAASAGRECEEQARRLWEEGKPDEYFFLEIFGSAVVEHLVAGLNARICNLAEPEAFRAIPHYSPGYTGWDVAEQNKLYELLTHGLHHPLPGPLEVLSSGMLRPKKSLLGVVGLTAQPAASGATPAVPCVNCAFSPCQYRRASYRFATDAGKPAPAAETPVAGRYTVSERALRKWAQERVQLLGQPNGSILARFRFDGTTCSNQGQPLAFDYTVLLGSRLQQYPIIRADCTPAHDDDGHTHMCSFLRDGPALLAAIRAERPLLGRPLGEVLFWTRESASAGCYCNATSRTHKWGLALEAIHYSLMHSPAFSQHLHATTPAP